MLRVHRLSIKVCISAARRNRKWFNALLNSLVLVRSQLIDEYGQLFTDVSLKDVLGPFLSDKSLSAAVVNATVFANTNRAAIFKPYFEE